MSDLKFNPHFNPKKSMSESNNPFARKETYEGYVMYCKAARRSAEAAEVVNDANYEIVSRFGPTKGITESAGMSFVKGAAVLTGCAALGFATGFLFPRKR